MARSVHHRLLCPAVRYESWLTEHHPFLGAPVSVGHAYDVVITCLCNGQGPNRLVRRLPGSHQAQDQAQEAAPGSQPRQAREACQVCFYFLKKKSVLGYFCCHLLFLITTTTFHINFSRSFEGICRLFQSFDIFSSQYFLFLIRLINDELSSHS